MCDSPKKNYKYIFGVFSWLLIDTDTVGNAIPAEVILDCIRKVGEQAIRVRYQEELSLLQFLCQSVSLEFLSWLSSVMDYKM